MTFWILLWASNTLIVFYTLRIYFDLLCYYWVFCFFFLNNPNTSRNFLFLSEYHEKLLHYLSKFFFPWTTEVHFWCSRPHVSSNESHFQLPGGRLYEVPLLPCNIAEIIYSLANMNKQKAFSIMLFRWNCDFFLISV